MCLTTNSGEKLSQAMFFPDSAKKGMNLTAAVTAFSSYMYVRYKENGIATGCFVPASSLKLKK